MHEVVLVEGDAPEPTRERRTGRRAVLWCAVIVVAVLVGAAAFVVQHRSDAAADARAARLALVPGVLAPVDGTLRPLWTLPPTESAVAYGDAADGVLLGGKSDGDGFALHGIDAATGTVLWRTPVHVPVDETFWSWCDPVRAADGRTLAVCTAGPDAPAASIALSSRTVWTVEPRTGQILTTRRARGDSSVLVTADQLVVAESPNTGRWNVRSLDPTTGEARWTFVPPIARTHADFAQPQLLDDGTGHVLLSLGGHVWLLDASGRPVVDRATTGGTWWVTLRPGTSLGRSFPSGGSDGIALLPDRTTIELTEQPVHVFPDDGSAPDLVLTLDTTPDGTTLVARSVATGAVTWTVRENALTALLVEDTLYIGTSDAVIALDPASGDVRWRRDVGHTVDQMTTDGDDLVVVAAPTTVEAYSRHDGRPTWTSDLAGTVDQIASVGFAPGTRHVVAWGLDGSVTALG